MDTSVESLEGNRVRLHVAVPAVEFERAVDAAFRKLAGEVRIPGFRPGKAPRRILEARLGTGAARDQALRDAVPDYYTTAVETEQLDTIAPPEIDITAGHEDGDVEFDAVVELRPIVSVTGYEGLRVTVPVPEVPDDAVDAEVDRLRERFADLEESAAPLGMGNFAEIDIKGYVHDEAVDGLTATDFLYELGSDLVVPALDRELAGKRPGDILKFVDVLPERWGERAGEEVAFQVLVKAVKRKVLPEPTDEWIADVTEFESLDELRNDVQRRLDAMASFRTRLAARDAVLDALADLVDVEAPDPLVHEDMERRLRDLARRLAPSGATWEQYLEATGQDRDEFVAELRDAAIRAVKSDLGLRAVVADQGIEASDEEVDAQVERVVERVTEDPRFDEKKARRDVELRGVPEAIRSDVARGKALQWIVDHAEVVDEAGNTVELHPDDLAGTEIEHETEPDAEDEIESETEEST